MDYQEGRKNNGKVNTMDFASPVEILKLMVETKIKHSHDFQCIQRTYLRQLYMREDKGT